MTTTLRVENTRTPAFDIKYKYFAAGCPLSSVPDLADFTRNYFPTGWSRVGDSITPSGGWLEVTDDIQFEGSLQYDWNESEVKWRANLSGWGWAASLYDTGYAVACLRKVVNPAVLNEVKILVNFDSTTDTDNFGSTGTCQMHTPAYSGGYAFPTGKYGNALQIAASTTNLVLNPSFEVDLTGWTNSVITAVRTSVCSHTGSWSASLQTAVGASSGFHTTHTQSASGGFYGSCHVLAESTSNVGRVARMELRASYTDSSSTANSASLALSASWQRLSASIVSNSAKTLASIRTYIGDSTTTGSGAGFYVDAVQLEYLNAGSALMTPYVDGDFTYGTAWAGTEHNSQSTRTSASWAYNSACVLPAANTPGTIGFWYKPDTNQTDNMAPLVAGSVDGNAIVFLQSGTQAGFHYGYVPSMGLSGSLVSGDWNHFAMTWNGSTVRGYVNGAQSASYATAFHNVPTGTCVHLGQDKYFGYNRANGLFDDFFVLDHELLPAEIAMVYNRGTNEVTGNDWQLEWLGAVESYSAGALDAADDRFTVVVGGMDVTLGKTDAPRLSVGKENIATQATVTVSSTLALPEMEAGLGEFIGIKQDVSAANINDDKMRSLWVSAEIPTITNFDYFEPPLDSAMYTSELYIKPHLGWSPDAWWFEIYGSITANVLGVVAMNRDNEYIYIAIPEAFSQTTDSIVVCGNRQLLDAMGGAPRAKLIIEASTEDRTTNWNVTETDAGIQASGCPNTFPDPHLHPTDGFIGLLSHFGFSQSEGYGWFDYVQYGNPWQNQPGGVPAPNVIKRLYNWGCGWEGGEADFDHGLDITNLPHGSSYQRVDDNQAIASWLSNSEPTAGYRLDHRVLEWVKMELPEHVTTLREDFLTATATTLEVNEDTSAWLGSGTGILENEAFAYTGLTGSSLTGVTGLASNHYVDALLYPTDTEGTAMSGYYLNTIEIKRQPGLANIKQARLFTSKWSGGATPDADISVLDWINDYDAPQISIDNNSPAGIGTATIAIDMKDRPNRWVRELLFIIDEMHNDSDGGPARAKINELKVNIQAGAISKNGSKTDSLDVSTTPAVIAKILQENTWLTASERFIDDTVTGYVTAPNWGWITDFQTAVAPVASVFNDLAKRSGCLVDWTMDGRCRILRDPWWPGGSLISEQTITLADIRGEYLRTNNMSTVTGVAISGRDTANEIMARIVTPPGATGSGVIEITDITVTNQAHAFLLASSILNRETHTDTMTLEIKGIGDWCKPARRLHLYDTDSVDLGIWFIDNVQHTWSTRERAKMFTTTLMLRLSAEPAPPAQTFSFAPRIDFENFGREMYMGVVW